MLQKVDPSSTFCNKKLEKHPLRGTLHQAIAHATCITTKLRDKLHEMLPSVLNSVLTKQQIALQLVAKRVETLLMFEATFRRHLDNYKFSAPLPPPPPPLISVVCIRDQIENLCEQHCKEGGGRVQMSMNCFVCKPGCVFHERALF